MDKYLKIIFALVFVFIVIVGFLVYLTISIIYDSSEEVRFSNALEERERTTFTSFAIYERLQTSKNTIIVLLSLLAIVTMYFILRLNYIYQNQKE